MSSVGSSDSSNSSNSSSSRQADDTIRKNREQYQQKQADLVKKQAKEVRRLNEEHYNEVERMKKAHSDQMEDLRKNTNQVINERDHKYNQDVEGLRDLYKKQMQSQADDTQRKEDTLRKATTGDAEQTKANNEARMTKLTQDYDHGLKEREHTYEESLKENREAQANAIQENRDKLQGSFDSQSKVMKDERNERVGNLQKTYDDYRQNTHEQQRSQETRHLREQQRSSENLLRAVRKERQSKADSEAYLRDGFKEGIRQTQERFEKQAAKERAALELSRDQMNSSVGDRIDNEVTRLKRDNQDLKDNNVRADLINKQKMHREVADITDSYQKNMDNYREQRDRAVADSNDRTHRDVQKVRHDLENQAVENNRFYREQMEDQNRISKEAYDNQKGDFEVRVSQQKEMTDRRVKNLYDTTAEEKSRMALQEGDNHRASQRLHHDLIKKVHSDDEADKQIAVNTLQDHIERQEAQHNERMAQVVAKYEKQIQTLKDQLVKEKRQNDETLKRTTEEMQRQHKIEMDQVALQNRDRLRNMDAHHNDELRELNKRNDARIDQVIAEVKKS